MAVTYTVIQGQAFHVEAHCNFDEVFIEHSNNIHSPEHYKHDTEDTQYIHIDEHITEAIGNVYEHTRVKLIFKMKGDVVDTCILTVHPDPKRKIGYAASSY